jgi:hypothetical protein
MASLDRILLIAFGLAAVLFLSAALFCFVKAFRVAGERDGDLKMFLWTAGGMVGLIIAGMSAAYILIPILLHF